ncbi:MliC family protein [Deinococcus planocerae]|uniref:MliC family protein n=1 Tax=Deinococcus planocerae TaxID=1737569 RepID=UPI000C7F6795|nr:MliC family protein [Deinococcus planocerae]
MKSLAALLTLLGLASPASAGGGGGPTVRYICAGNIRIQATYTGPHARVVVGHQVLRLTQALSGSGARYMGGGYTWWINGGVAELYRGETLGTLTSLRQCQEG